MSSTTGWCDTFYTCSIVFVLGLRWRRETQTLPRLSENASSNLVFRGSSLRELQLRKSNTSRPLPCRCRHAMAPRRNLLEREYSFVEKYHGGPIEVGAYGTAKKTTSMHLPIFANIIWSYLLAPPFPTIRRNFHTSDRSYRS